MTRARGLMASPQRLLTEARRAGMRAPAGKWHEPSIDDYAACACQHFYPDITPPAR